MHLFREMNEPVFDRRLVPAFVIFVLATAAHAAHGQQAAAPGEWRSYGGTAYAPKAWQASREAQIAIAEKVLADAGWKAWPACSIKLGLR